MVSSDMTIDGKWNTFYEKKSGICFCSTLTTGLETLLEIGLKALTKVPEGTRNVSSLKVPAISAVYNTDGGNETKTG